MSDESGIEIKHGGEHSVSFVESLRNTLLKDPEKPLSETFPELRDTVKGMPPEEYLDYLKFLSYKFAVDSGDLVVDQIDILTDRLEKTTRTALDSNDEKEHKLSREIIDKTGNIIEFLDVSKGATIPREKLQKLYQLIHSDIPSLRVQAAQLLPQLIRFDMFHNEKAVIPLQMEKDVLEMITDPEKRDIPTAITLLQSLHGAGNVDLRSLYFKTLTALPPQDTDAIKFVFQTFANFFSLETALNIMVHETHGDSVDPVLKQNADYILRLFTKDGAVFVDAEELYEQKLDMRTWKPNAEHLPHDVEVIMREFPTEQSLLDVACGAGPHIKALTDAGKTVAGVDITERNVQAAKELNPTADIKQGDWFHLPFGNKSFDGGYCIGRSAAHNFTVFDWLKFLHEAHRVVNGPFMIDHARPDQGGVGKRISHYQETADKLGITNREPGAHIGNPLGESFTYRNILSDDQMKACALLCSYEAQIVDTFVYTDQTNQENTNIYWKLTPLTEKLDDEVRLDAARRAVFASSYNA